MKSFSQANLSEYFLLCFRKSSVRSIHFGIILPQCREIGKVLKNHTGNFAILLPLFSQKVRQINVLLKSLTINWFHGKKFAWQWISRFSTLCKRDDAKNISWNQLFSNFFSENFDFTGKNVDLSIKIVFASHSTFSHCVLHNKLISRKFSDIWFSQQCAAHNVEITFLIFKIGIRRKRIFHYILHTEY